MMADATSSQDDRHKLVKWGEQLGGTRLAGEGS